MALLNSMLVSSHNKDEESEESNFEAIQIPFLLQDHITVNGITSYRSDKSTSEVPAEYSDEGKPELKPPVFEAKGSLFSKKRQSQVGSNKPQI